MKTITRRNEPELTKVRGHHLHILDIFKHQPNEHKTLENITQHMGYGNYKTVIKPTLEYLASHPEAMIRLTDELDSLCYDCKKNRPDCAKSVGNFDRRTLESLGLKVGQEITAGELIQKIKGCGNEELERIKKLLKEKKAGHN